MHINLMDAATKLTELVAATERGEEVVITRGEQPIAKLVAIAPGERIPKKERVFGAYKGLISLGPEFFDPLPDDELALWNGEDPPATDKPLA
jgi:prevent-host-death family protein